MTEEPYKSKRLVTLSEVEESQVSVRFEKTPWFPPEGHICYFIGRNGERLSTFKVIDGKLVRYEE